MHTVVGKEIKISSQARFNKAIAKYRLAVVMFYQRDKQLRHDKSLRQQITDLEVMFRSLSKAPTYMSADVQFLRVNIGKKDLEQVAQDYGVKDMPAFLLFNGGLPARDQQKNIAVLPGFVSRTQLQAFIEKHLQETIDEVMEEKAEARKRRLERARIRYYERPYYYHYPYYWGGYWPYWHGYYYW